MDEVMGPGTGDLLLMLLCYGYVLAMILASDRLEGILKIDRKASRKFLHAMIGNLPLVIPFFSWRPAPALVAAPFILVTYLASPYSPNPGLRERLKGLSDLTEEGHNLGLILYAASYTLLAALFPKRPSIIAAGVLPMAYGDSVAALVGKRYGKRIIINGKTLEGSIAMFAASLITLSLSLAYFSTLYGYNFAHKLLPALATATVVAIAEALSPRGLDNIAVPLLGALAFSLVEGGL
ncbi:MAG: phosphatidate cytidylyltransferase [Candidatus Bathyarchaeota archaeon]|nr:MAG: phosphatidate cytidylyltransferase [Candidatus Bathyarchaeota archaeon]